MYHDLFEQATNISKAHAYDILRKQVAELKTENEGLKKRLEAVDIEEEETVIKSVSTEHTGGNIYNDVIRLKGGEIVRISDGAVCIFRSDEADAENNPIGTVYY